MADGFRIADVYVRALLDRDQLRADIASLPAELDGEADAAGQALGDRMGRSAGDEVGKGIGDGIGRAPVEAPSTRKGTESGDRFGSAFSSKVRAALASLPPADIELNDEYAQAKLDYIREELIGLGKAKVGVDISDSDAIAKLTVLRTELDELGAASASVQVKVDTAAASLAIDKFLADTEVKSEVAGDKVGKNLTEGAAKSAGGASPMIVSMIAGGLIAGGPAIAAASVLMFGGIAAYAAKSNADVQASFSALKTHVVGDVQEITSQTSGEFTAAIADVQRGFDQVEPAIRSAMTAGATDVHDLVDSLVSATDTAVPAFNRALQQGQPVVQGLDALVRDLGTGVATMMDEVTAHSGAAGSVLGDLGAVVRELLGGLGTLAGEGAELGQVVLPPLVDVLRATNTVLRFIAPVLPEVAIGFAAFKTVGAASGPLKVLSQDLAFASYNADGLKGKLTTIAGSGVSTLKNNLPALGIILGTVSAAFAAQSSDVQRWGQDLLDGGAKAEQAKQQIQALQGTAYELSHGMQGGIADLLGYGTALNVTSQSGQKAQQTAKDLYNAMSPLEQRQQDVTKATNDLQLAVQKYGAQSPQAAAASDRLSTAQQRLSSFQTEVKTATEGATTASQNQQGALQGIADKASAANTQIQLLKGALDALTGKAMTADEAEIAVTQAVDAATQAVQGHSAALSFNHGQLDLSNAKSASAAQLLMNLASTQHQEIATLEQQGASQDVVSQKADAMRQQFIVTAMQMGANAQEAQDLANRYFGIPSQVATNIVAYDNSSATIQHVQNMIAGLHDKNIFITTYERVVSTGPAGLGGSARAQAVGGIAVPMATGGIIGMADGGRADIYQPNNPTFLIGDNKRVREAFIPEDDSYRSKAILTQTASDMGYRLTPTTGSGQSNGGGNTTIKVDINIPPGAVLISDRDLPPMLIAAMQQALLKKERASR